jgi:hypothetical protein
MPSELVPLAVRDTLLKVERLPPDELRKEAAMFRGP